MSAGIILIGLLLVIVSIRGTHKELFELLKGDLTGSDSFLPWIVALSFVYAIGFIPSLKPVSRAFLVLVVLVLFLRRGTGFFDQFNRQLGIR